MEQTCIACGKTFETEGVYFNSFGICEFCLEDPEKKYDLENFRQMLKDRDA